MTEKVPNSFDLEDTRRHLIALRVKHGADTPIGHRCSNIVEGIDNFMASGRTSILDFVKKQTAELAGILQ